MTQPLSRRAFLRGARTSEPVRRPPGSLAEVAFLRACTQCGKCEAACPEHVIVSDSRNYPQLSFTDGACTSCNQCIEICETGALSDGQSQNWLAEVTDTCLSLNGVQCRTCQDHCDERAISFKLALAGRAQPLVDATLCTGCGGCVAPCPVSAIKFVQETKKLEPAQC